MEEKREYLPVVVTEERAKEVKEALQETMERGRRIGERIGEAARVRAELYPEVIGDILRPVWVFTRAAARGFWAAVWDGVMFPFLVRVTRYDGEKQTRGIDWAGFSGRSVGFVVVASVYTWKIVLGKWRLWVLAGIGGGLWIFKELCRSGVVCSMLSGAIQEASGLFWQVLLAIYGGAFLLGFGFGAWRTKRAFPGLRAIVKDWLDRKSGVRPDRSDKPEEPEEERG